MTWFRQLMNLERIFVPEHKGILSAEEINFIKNNITFPADEFGLRNLRDMTVLTLDKIADSALDRNDKDRYFRVSDLISGIVGIIDHELIKLGCEIW